MNQYHPDDSIDEMLKFLDNAHDIFLRKFGKDYPIVGAQIEAIYNRVSKIVEEEPCWNESLRSLTYASEVTERTIDPVSQQKAVDIQYKTDLPFDIKEKSE